MGVVYKARQVRLKRLVALKMIRAGRTGEAVRVRFRSEAEAVARLQHPNIVQVYDVGEFEGELYCALEYLAGGSLDRRLAGTPLSAMPAARLVELMARAIHAAHEQNLVHRDLKPANILLADISLSPETWTPKVTDFGLAKFLDADAPGLTQTDAVMGTPSYMAPEQALGRTAEVDRAADVYALGAILYECLTGRPPFKAASTLETLTQVRSQDPVPIRSLQPGVPRDLETIAMQCLRKEPARRYPTALHLAEDLRRFQAGEPVKARPVTTLERAVKWIKRRPGAAALIALLVLTVAGFSAALYHRNLDLTDAVEQLEQAKSDLEGANEGLVKQTERANNEAKTARTKEGEARASEGKAKVSENNALKAAEIARRGQYAAQLSRSALLAERDPMQAQALLEDPQLCPPDLRDFTWHLLYSSARRNLYSVSIGKGEGDVAFVSDNTLLGITRWGKELRLRRFDAADGTLLGEVSLPGGATLSADNLRAAVVTPQNELKLWTLEGSEIGSWKLPGAERITTHAFSQNLHRLATVDRDTTLHLWNGWTGELEKGPITLERPVLRIEFTPDASRLIAVERSPADPSSITCSVWDVAAGKMLSRLDGAFKVSPKLLISPDGRLLATWAEDRSSGGNTGLAVHDLTTGRLLPMKVAFPRGIKMIEFTADGRTLTAFSRGGGMISGGGGESNALSIWDVSGKDGRILAHLNLIDATAVLSANKKTLAVGAYQGMKILDTATGQAITKPSGLLETRTPVALSPDGKTLVTTGMKLWDVGASRERMTIGGGRRAVFSPDGKRLAVFADGSAVTVWDVSEEPPVARRLDWSKPVVSVDIARGGHTLAVFGGKIDGFPASRHGELRLFDVQRGNLRATVFENGYGTHTSGIAFSPNGDTLAWDEKNQLRLQDSKGAQRNLVLDRQPPKPSGPPIGFPITGMYFPESLLSYAPDGQTVAVVENNVLVFKDVTTGKSLSKLEPPGRISTRPAFPHDGKHIAAGGQDGHVWVWDRTTAQHRVGPFRHQGGVLVVAYHPDGSQVASGGADGVVAIWNLKDDAQVVLRGHHGPVTGLAFSPPEGRTLVSASRDLTVRFWDPVTGQSRATFSEHTYPVSCLAFSPDGSTLVTGGSGGDKGGDLLVWRSRIVQEGVLTLNDREPLERVAVSPDATTAVTWSSRGKVRLWDLKTARELDPPELPAEPVTPNTRFGQRSVLSLELDANNRVRLTAATGTWNGTTLFRSTGGTSETEQRMTTGPGAHLAYAPDARTALGIQQAGQSLPITVQKRLDLKTGEVKLLYELRNARPTALSSDGKYLVVSDRAPGGFQVHDALTGKFLWKTDTPRAILPFPFGGMMLSPDGSRILLPGLDSIQLRDLSSGKEILTHKLGKQLNFFEANSRSDFSPDGSFLAVTQSGKHVEVFDASTGRLVIKIDKELNVTQSAFTLDGKQLLVLLRGQTPTILLWSLVEKQEVRRFSLKPVSNPSIHPVLNGRMVVVAADTGNAQLWDWTTGAMVEDVKLPEIRPNQAGLTPDGKTLFLLNTKGTCQLWDAVKWKPKKEVSPRGAKLTGFGWTADSKTLFLHEVGHVHVCDATTGKRRAVHSYQPVSTDGSGHAIGGVTPDGTGVFLTDSRQETQQAGVCVWVGDGTEPRIVFSRHPDRVFAVALTRDGKRAISAGENSIRIWKTATGEEEGVLEGHKAGVYRLVLSPDEKLLASASHDGTVRIWNLGRKTEITVLKGLSDELKALTFSGDGKRLATGGDDLLLRVWHVDGGRLQARYRGHQSTINDAVFSADGQHLISVSADGSLRMWVLPRKEQSQPGTTPEAVAERESISPIALTRDGRTLFQGLRNGTVKVVDRTTRATRELAVKHDGPVLAMALSPDGSRLATGSADGKVKLFDVHTGKERATWEGHDHPIRALAFSSDGSLLASGDGLRSTLFGPLQPSKLLIRQVETGKLLASFRGDRGRINAVAFSPSGNSLASAGDDHKVIVWSLATHTPLNTYTHNGPIHTLTFTPDGQQIIAGGQDGPGTRMGPIRVWPVQTESTRGWPDPDAERRGQSAAQAGDWPRAAADLELAAHQPDASLSTWAAVLLARRAAAPKDARLSCRELLDRFESDAGLSVHLLDSCRITPCDDGDARRLVKVAERLVATRRDADSLCFLGGALYRAGRLEEAARTLGESNTAHGQGGFAATWVFLAMAQQRLGRGEEARTSLARYEEWLKGKTFATWQQTTHWRLLHEEARRLIFVMSQAAE
jgi:eukaryotic-like serine/threonine-protein kinase